MTPLRSALRDVSRINAFFSLATPTPRAQWHRLSTLWENATVLDGAVTAARDRLCAGASVTRQDIEWRVAASMFAQGLASRVYSPQLALAVCHGVVANPTTLVWHHPRSGSLTLGAPVGPGLGVDTSAAEHIAAAMREHVVRPVLTPLYAALDRRGSIAQRLLWGNTVSAVVGAARALAQDRPAHAPVVDAVTKHLLDHEPLRGLSEPTADLLSDFTRRSCCLYYRVPGAGMCGDCCLRLRGRPARRGARRA